ncbi:hypothetical protein ABZ646_31305 [Streptomyces sp. NPDC007162]|uniref:hypothetical protein n=1 Tax=Streptomyces sp. NPDC007162 TaxID=3156917 RepID=UPI0033F8AF8B
MSRHASSPNPTAQRALIALATASVALGAGAATAAATPQVVHDAVRSRSTSVGPADPQAALTAVGGLLPYVTGPVTALKPNPLAGTGVDPLDNGVGTRLADFEPLTSKTVTEPVAEAPSIGDVPVVGQLLLGG